MDTRRHALARLHGPKVGNAGRGRTDEDAWDLELTKSQLRELERRVKDSRDPTRFMIVSRFSQRFILYYRVDDDVFVMNDRAYGTLFKRQGAALAVSKLLGSGIRVVRCTTRLSKGKRVPVLGKRWVPDRRGRPAETARRPHRRSEPRRR